MGMHGNRSGVAVTSQWAPKELRAPMTAEEKKEREKMEKAKKKEKVLVRSFVFWLCLKDGVLMALNREHLSAGCI